MLKYVKLIFGRCDICDSGMLLTVLFSRAMTLQDEPDRGDVRILFYRHSLLQQLDVHIATLSKNINSQLSCTPGF